jgi:hypothetical protein
MNSATIGLCVIAFPLTTAVDSLSLEPLHDVLRSSTVPVRGLPCRHRAHRPWRAPAVSPRSPKRPAWPSHRHHRLIRPRQGMALLPLCHNPSAMRLYERIMSWVRISRAPPRQTVLLRCLSWLWHGRWSSSELTV